MVLTTDAEPLEYAIKVKHPAAAQHGCVRGLVQADHAALLPGGQPRSLHGLGLGRFLGRFLLHLDEALELGPGAERAVLHMRGEPLTVESVVGVGVGFRNA